MTPIIRKLAVLAMRESGLADSDAFRISRGGPAYSIKRIAIPRYAAMKVAHEQGRSYRMIAYHLGMSDHTSAVHGCKRAAELELTDMHFAALIAKLRASVLSYTLGGVSEIC